MSFVRKSDISDVYIYGSNTKLVCCLCELNNQTDIEFDKYSQLMSHLDSHLNVNHKIPQYAFDRLKDALKNEGDIYAKAFKKKYKV